MNNLILSEDSKAMLLICSDILKDYIKDDVKPYTLAEWNKLADKLQKSEMRSPKAFFLYKPIEWKNILDITEEEVSRLEKLLSNGARLAIELDELAKLGIFVTTRAEKSYPYVLKEKLGKKAPTILYYAGDISILETKKVAIVGSRNIDRDAIAFTEKLAQKCALEGLTVISGGARGVDSIAQDIALYNGGKVVSVLSSEMKKVIKKKEYRDAILNKKLLLISTNHPDTIFTVYRAMERNKYIYALSNYSFVVSSDYKKGGTWAGAEENIKNNWVCLYVRNEDNIPIGNKKLIEMGGIPFDSKILDDKNVKLINILDERSRSIKGNIAEQLSLLNELENSRDKNEVATIVNDNENIFKKDEIKNDIKRKAYDIFLPILKEILNTPKTLKEISQELDLIESQLKIWIKRMEEENIIEKTGRPIKYKLK